MVPDPVRTEPLVRAEGALALALGSGLLGALGARLVEPSAPAVAWLLAPLLALVGLMAGARPHAPNEDATVTWIAVGGAFVAIPAAFCAGTDSWLCVALFAAAPCGLLLNALWLSLLGHLRDLSEGRSCEDVDLARSRAGGWLLRLAAVGGLVAVARADGYLVSVALLVAAAGAHRLGLGLGARRRRSRWLAEVADGRRPGWRLVPRSALPPEQTAALPSVMRARPAASVLLETSGAGPYREGLGGVPRALVPAPRHTPSPVPWRPPSAESLASLAVLASVFAPFAGLVFGAVVAQVMAPRLGDTPDPAGLVGWVLLVSGPATGTMVAGLARLARPARPVVLAVGLAIYSLLAPAFCWLIGLTAYAPA